VKLLGIIVFAGVAVYAIHEPTKQDSTTNAAKGTTSDAARANPQIDFVTRMTHAGIAFTGVSCAHSDNLAS
jgi:hypothetical protein